MNIVLNINWGVISKGADIVGFVSLVISVVTFFNTRKIRSSMLAHVETSEYRQAIDNQINELEAFKTLLVEGKGLSSDVFLKLIVCLRDIGISYETILPTKLTKKIENLSDHIKQKLYDKQEPYDKHDLEKCISMLVYVMSELKKEQRVI